MLKAVHMRRSAMHLSWRLFDFFEDYDPALLERVEPVETGPEDEDEDSD